MKLTLFEDDETEFFLCSVKVVDIMRHLNGKKDCDLFKAIADKLLDAGCIRMIEQVKQR